jgi:hypothetical protein
MKKPDLIRIIEGALVYRLDDGCDIPVIHCLLEDVSQMLRCDLRLAPCIRAGGFTLDRWMLRFPPRAAANSHSYDAVLSAAEWRGLAKGVTEGTRDCTAASLAGSTTTL